MTISNNHAPVNWRVRIRHIIRKLIKPISLERRAEVQVMLRDASHPDFDFFLLVVMSCVIATLGLLIDSPATIIGAMLVAPLMSPIIGIGLASITGDSHLLTNAASALARGAILATLIAFILTWGNSFLPFISFQALPVEVMARTHPSPIDLLIALAGGVAAAFALAQPNLSAALPGVAIATALMPPLCTIGIGIALGRWDVAGGATLLFITNAVTIAFAATLVFFALGFVPRPAAGSKRLPRSLWISASLTIGLIVPLSLLSVQFVQRASQNRIIETIIQQEVRNIGDAELVEWTSDNTGEVLHLNITIRTTTPLRYEDSVALQKAIADQLQKPVSVVINEVFATRLDPMVPPTFTSTPTVTPTSTPGPSPTPTKTLTPSPTPSPTMTATATPTDTPTPSLTPTATATPTNTPTPAQAVVTNSLLPSYCLRLRQSPNGPIISYLNQQDPLTLLYQQETIKGLVWIEVKDEEGRIGWIPLACTALVTATPTRTPSITPTTQAPTLTSTTEAVATFTLTPTP